MTDPTTRAPRSSEGGAIAVMVALSFTALFALTALAVDAGYLFQARQHIQAAADAAVMAGMPDLTTTSSTLAKSNALAVATASGYSGAVVSTPTSSQLQVLIDVTKPMFFGRLFGMTSREFKVTAIGQLVTAPAIFGGSAVCHIPGSTEAVGMNGNVTVNGDVESNAGISWAGPSYSGTGAMNYASTCTCSENGGACPGASPSGSTFPFPFPYTTSSFTCTIGSMTGPPIPNLSGPFTGGVYCSGGSINVNGSISGTATFVSAGQITLNSGGAINLTGAANGVIAFSSAALDCLSTPAINVGNALVTLTGSLIAPNGCVNTNAAPLNLTGSIAGAEVGIQGTSTITPGATGGSYRLYQ